MIRRGEKQDEIMQRLGRGLCLMDEALPFQQWRGMHAAQGEPAITILQHDGEILRMSLNVRSNTPPADLAIFATKVVIICRHSVATMTRLGEKSRVELIEWGLGGNSSGYGFAYEFKGTAEWQ